MRSKAVVPVTEGGTASQWAGATLHDELALFVQAGLSPQRVLRAATVDAASLLRVEGLTSEIAEGTSANLLLVDGDPRTDLARLRTPFGVMVRGHWYGSNELTTIRALFGLLGT